MEKECLCKKYIRSGEALEIFSKMKNLGGTQFIDGALCGEVQSTNVLKCKECSDLYLWNQYSGGYSHGDIIVISKYNLDIKENELLQILEKMKGIVSEGEILKESALLKHLNK